MTIQVQPERSPWIAIPGILGVLYFMVVFSCFALLPRLLLQSAALWSFSFCFLYGVTWYILKKRLEADTPTQQARVKRLKTIPSVPHPAIKQKTFCWIELVEDDQDGGDFSVGNTGTMAQATDLALRDPEEEEPTEKTLEDIRAWSLNHPCIIISLEENVQVGDLRTVHLIDGDPTRPFYRPYQEETLGRMLSLVVKALGFLVMSLLALYYLFGGLPVFLASSQDLEDTVNGWWDFFGWLADKIVDKFPALADDDDGSEPEEEDKDCRIPPYIAVAYDLLILMQVFFMVVCPIRIYWKSKKFYGMEEPPADSYQLLRGDEDEDELNEQGENAAPAGATSHAVVV